eukprot:559759-Prymnesium_polylepis.1
MPHGQRISNPHPTCPLRPSTSHKVNPTTPSTTPYDCVVPPTGHAACHRHDPLHLALAFPATLLMHRTQPVARTNSQHACERNGRTHPAARAVDQALPRGRSHWERTPLVRPGRICTPCHTRSHRTRPTRARAAVAGGARGVHLHAACPTHKYSGLGPRAATLRPLPHAPLPASPARGDAGSTHRRPGARVWRSVRASKGGRWRPMAVCITSTWCWKRTGRLGRAGRATA